MAVLKSVDAGIHRKTLDVAGEGSLRLSAEPAFCRMLLSSPAMVLAEPIESRC